MRTKSCVIKKTLNYAMTTPKRQCLAFPVDTYLVEIQRVSIVNYLSIEIFTS